MLAVWLVKYRDYNKNILEIFKLFCLGALFYSTSAGIFFVASQYIGTGLSMVILFTFPAIVMFFNWCLYKIKISKHYYMAIILMLLGMLLLVDLSDVTFDILGLGLGLTAAVLYACYIIASKKITVSPILSTIMISSGCSTACLLFALINHSFMIPSTLLQWSHILGFGILSTALPMLLLLEGLKKISAEKASILSVLEPVFVVIFGIILLEETLRLPQVIGIITVLSGALITLFSHKLKNKVI
jgi:drug/metabolite transporter (DMT)-like permease